MLIDILKTLESVEYAFWYFGEGLASVLVLQGRPQSSSMSNGGPKFSEQTGVLCLEIYIQVHGCGTGDAEPRLLGTLDSDQLVLW